MIDAFLSVTVASAPGAKVMRFDVVLPVIVMFAPFEMV
jgi:hypothetical protein